MNSLTCGLYVPCYSFSKDAQGPSCKDQQHVDVYESCDSSQKRIMALETRRLVTFNSRLSH